MAPDAGRYYVQAVNDKNGENKTGQPITLSVESKSVEIWTWTSSFRLKLIISFTNDYTDANYYIIARGVHISKFWPITLTSNNLNIIANIVN